MKIQRVLMSESEQEKLCALPDVEAQNTIARACDWGLVSDGLHSEPMPDTRARGIVDLCASRGIVATVVDLAGYRFFRATAHPDLDGFSTLTIATEKEDANRTVRIVAMLDHDVRWQLARFSSGLGHAEELPESGT